MNKYIGGIVFSLIVMLSYAFNTASKIEVFENEKRTEIHFEQNDQRLELTNSHDKNQKKLVITGNFPNAKKSKIFLEKKPTYKSYWETGSVTIGESIIDSLGNYRMEVDSLFEPAYYYIRVDSTWGIGFPLNGKEENIVINGVLEKCRKMRMSIDGSDEADEYFTLIQAHKGIEEIQLFIDKIQDSPNIVAAVFATRSRKLRTSKYYKIYQNLASKLRLEYPNATLTKEYSKMVSRWAPRIRNIEVGKPAPEIRLPNPDGKLLSLSDLKGQIVLLDFWASWCGPCRRHNSEIVEIYEKYKDQGFTVFSVSLDGVDEKTKNTYTSIEQFENQIKLSKSEWMEAIEKDNLSWKYHVSDLKKWDSEIFKTYESSSIPKLFLIDRLGKIAAINPRKDLEIQISKLLN